MTNSNADKINSYQKQKNKEEMKQQVISFASMIGFTLIAFLIVGAELMEPVFAIPLLLILAVVQVGFQFYYFMHLKDKGHEVPALLIYAGVFVTFLIALCMTTIIWW